MREIIDIYRAAKLVIDRHGEDAPLYAAARTAVLAGEGDLPVRISWPASRNSLDEGLLLEFGENLLHLFRDHLRAYRGAFLGILGRILGRTLAGFTRMAAVMAALRGSR